MKFWILSTLSTVSLLILSGCGAQPLPAKNATIDKTLPKIVLTKHGVIVGMKSAAFEWKSILDPRVEGIYIYRENPSSSENSSGLQYLKTLKSRFKTHFVDTTVEPNSHYSYKFRTFSADAEGVDSEKIVLTTLPVLSSVSWIHSITGMPRTAKIIWRPDINERVDKYVIERKTLDNNEWEEIGSVKGRLNAEYIDSGLDDNHVYFYRVRVVTFDNIVSTPSAVVKVLTKALPRSVTNIKVTTNLPRKIKITWSPSAQEDFSQYYLYRSEKLDSGYELIAKLFNNSFEDKIEEDGKTYFYRVSVVDKDGLESISDKNSIQGKTLNKPEAPAIVNAKLIGSDIKIEWSKTDPRSRTYVVEQTHKEGWFDESTEKFTDIKRTSFVDKNVALNSTYSYKVYSVDANGIQSEASMEVKVTTPESTEIQEAPIQESVEEDTVNKNLVQEHTEDIVAPNADLDLSGL